MFVSQIAAPVSSSSAGSLIPRDSTRSTTRRTADAAVAMLKSAINTRLATLSARGAPVDDSGVGHQDSYEEEGCEYRYQPAGTVR